LGDENFEITLSDLKSRKVIIY